MYCFIILFKCSLFNFSSFIILSFSLIFNSNSFIYFSNSFIFILFTFFSLFPEDKFFTFLFLIFPLLSDFTELSFIKLRNVFDLNFNFIKNIIHPKILLLNNYNKIRILFSIKIQ